MNRLLVVLVLLLGSLHVSAHGLDPSRFEFQQHLGAALPASAQFTDERGRRVAIEDYLGRSPIVLVMGYFDCPNLCDTTLAGVVESLERGGLRPDRDYRGLFVSIDPREGPERAGARKREQFGESAGWSFLTGPSSPVLANAAGFPYAWDEHEHEFVHPAGFIVVSPSGSVSRYFPGVRFDPGEVREALEQAVMGRTGSLADRLLLLCTHFDPITGKYGPLVWNITRALVLLFAIAMAWLFLRQRSRVR